jgi:hypothetical protein
LTDVEYQLFIAEELGVPVRVGIPWSGAGYVARSDGAGFLVAALGGNVLDELWRVDSRGVVAVIGRYPPAARGAYPVKLDGFGRLYDHGGGPFLEDYVYRRGITDDKAALVYDDSSDANDLSLASAHLFVKMHGSSLVSGP